MITTDEWVEASVTYRAMYGKGLQQGAFHAARRILMRIGMERFGEPSARVLAKLNEIEDVQRLEDLIMRTQIVSCWRELFNQ